MEIVLIYAALGFFTFGHRWHRAKIKPGLLQELDETDRMISSVFAGLFFWLYWPGVVAIFLMQPRKKEGFK